MKQKFQLIFFLLFVMQNLYSQTVLISYNSSWKYLDNGTNQGTAWRATAFNDASWVSGNAQLGYGDGDEATVVSYGPNINNKYVTTYFRKTITVANATAFNSFTLSVKRDDGAVVFINGTQRFKTNMPNNVSYTTKASSDAADDGNTPQTISLPAGALVNGTNVIAVEIHQRTVTSTDISFDLQLTGNDATVPTVTAFNPADNAVNVAVNSNLVLNFSETIQKGTGNILIKEAGIITQTIDVASAAVSVAGNIVTIDPANLGNGAAVNIEMAAGVFKDLANNNYAGITNATTWNFGVLFTDVSPPVVTNYSPPDNAVDVSAATNLVLTFNETVQKGTGNILIKENGVTIQTIDVTDASVTVAGNIVTIDPAGFSNNAAVNIEITAGSFKDLANNNYAGITDAVTWNFAVIGVDITPPTVTSYSPPDDATNVAVGSNLVINFNENVQKATGNILVKENGVTIQTIDVTAASVTVAGNVVTINPADFGYTKAVNIEIAAGAFKDLANNNYAGITDAVTWNFNTEDPVTGPQTFIAFGASWKYYATTAAPAGAWQSLGYADGAWPAGPSQLGYGDGDEATCVPSGGGGTLCLPTGNKWITTYFRKEITVSNPLAFSSFAGSVKRDDGIVLYVNGIEVYRNNMPTGTITYGSLASTAASDDGNTAQNFSISSSAFISGNNVIAVEMHQNAVTSSDLSFDLQLIGTVPGAATLTRGPYMNSALQNGIVIRWRSDVATNSKVNYGTMAGSLTQSITDNTVTTEHVVTLTGLTANTLYYYSIGSTTQTLQGDANNYFKTMPAAGSTQKIRIMAMGDMGNNSTNQINVRNAWQTFNGTNYTDAWLLMGDNAYNNGLDAEYQTNFFNIYQGSLTKNHVLWPSPGNHDYAQSTARQADHLIPYYDMFTLPANGQAGGVASNTEAFYSYNYANVHFVALDSYGWETGNTRLYDTLGPQAVWLKQDLAANTQPWTVVYFHHPPYTKGSHNSDTETELINMRQKIVPILERYKVDLVLTGHSHSYERSYLINGHYGVENTFSAASHALSSSSAKYDGSSNSCGQLGGTTSGYPHDAMYYSNVTEGGTLYFEVENNRLAAKWIGADGVIRDNFTIMKNVNQTTTINIVEGNNATLTASWIGNYTWSTSATTQSIIVSPAVNTTYTVTDGAGCITDVFNVVVTPAFQHLITNEQTENQIKLFPAIAKKGQVVNIQSALKQSTEFMLVDNNGRVLKRYSPNRLMQVQTNNLLPGVYFLKWNENGKNAVKKFVVVN
jgi:methionine-rich copper-binding protein CopC